MSGREDAIGRYVDNNLLTFKLTLRHLNRSHLVGAEAALLHIDGMVCPSCGLVVLNALLDLEGVVLTEVLWERGVVTVAYNPAFVSSEQLLQAIVTAGSDRWHYHAHLLGTLPASDVVSL